MKTLSLLPLTLKKARTFDSITDIDQLVSNKIKKLTGFFTRLAEHNLTFLQDNSPKILRIAQSELVHYEGLLEKIIDQTIPINGRAYSPSGLERQLIDELERKDGHWLASDEVIH